MSDQSTQTDRSRTVILDDERVDDLQLQQLRIIQKKSGFRFGMDAVLLADFARVEPRDRAADFGTGTGILPLLISGRGRGEHFDAFEVQADMAHMAMRSVQLNGLESRIDIHSMPVEQADKIVPAGSLDVIVCNPPYGLPGTTLLNPSNSLSLARHQSSNGMIPWFRMAYRLLKGKGRFAMIYPAPRMLEAMQTLSAARLEPKRVRLIYPSAHKPANLVLIEAVKDAKPMLHHMPPLIVYEQDGRMSEELKRIYHLTDSSVQG